MKEVLRILSLPDARLLAQPEHLIAAVASKLQSPYYYLIIVPSE